MKSITILLAAACATLASAAEITTELVTLSLGGGVPTYYYEDHKDVAKLDVSAQGIGSPVAYRGPAVLALHDNAGNLAPRDHGTPPPAPTHRITLPAGEDRILLVFSNTSENRTEVRAFGISSGKIKAGDYRVFNFSSKSVYVILNDEKTVIKPGTPVDISSATWKSDALDMEVRFGLREEEGLRQCYSSVWGHRPTRRTFLFILDQPDEFNPFEIRSYYDVPAVP